MVARTQWKRTFLALENQTKVTKTKRTNTIKKNSFCLEDIPSRISK